MSITDKLPNASFSIRESSASRHIFRPTRVALIHSSKDTSKLEYLQNCFSKLAIPVFSGEEEFQAEEFDVIGYLGNDPARFDSFHQPSGVRSTTRILFLPKDDSESHSHVGKYDALVFCDDEEEVPSFQGVNTVYHFFECLVEPSLLNIDISDVRNIARGVGLSFYSTGDNSEQIIDRLPEECSIAKSALLHFSCCSDVTLGEVYRVTRAISVKKKIDSEEKYQILSEYLPSSLSKIQRREAERIFRKMNIKLGLRVADNAQEELADIDTLKKHGRMRLTGILFGI